MGFFFYVTIRWVIEMIKDRNRKIVIDFFEEVYNKRNLDYVMQFFSRDYYEHREDGARSNADAVEIINGAFYAFPDLSCSVEDIVVEEKTVFVRVLFRATHKGKFIDIQANDKKVAFEAMEQFKIESNRIAESWGSWPLYDIFEQCK